MKRIGKGKVLEELVKGSLDYTIHLVQEAFRAQFPYVDGGANYWVNEVFANHVIVSSYADRVLKTDEYYMVTYTRNGDAYIFAARDAWEMVELTYQPQTVTPLPAASPQMGESTQSGGNGKRKGHRLEESVIQSVELLETEDDNPNGPWRIKGIGITADVVNANGRRYPATVLEAAVRKLKGHLHESAGQGRLLQPASLTTGESDHPKDKGNRRPLLLETVINWENVTFDGKQIMLEGNLLGTSNGKDIRAIMQGGVKPGISQRAYGDSKVVKEGGLKIEEVTELEITGFDLTAPNEESDPYAEVTFHESINSQKGDEVMNLEELIKLLKDNPEVLKGITEAQIRQMGAEQLATLEEKVRSGLGIDAKADIAESLKSMSEKARKFEESQAKALVDAAITEATKDLPFGEKLNKQFTDALKASGAKTPEDVKALAEAKRKEYGAIASDLKLGSKGFNFSGPLQTLGSVLENETGTPDFARAAFEIQESILRSENRQRRDLRKVETPSEILAARLLERFDSLHRQELMAEARAFEEAELTSNLNLPYSVSRAITEEALPDLVSANIFEMGLMESSPERLYYEVYAGETGYTSTVTDEVVTADHDAWVNLANRGRLTPGSVVVTNSGATTTYVEGDDYVIDYAGGRFKALSAGDITDAQSLKVDYGYTAVRKGEMAPIERGKLTLAYQIVEAAADRLADQISREAMVFSRSQLGMDATTRTMVNLVRQLNRKIDQGQLYMAWSAVKSVANNSGGSWTPTYTQAGYAELVRLMGLAQTKVFGRYYVPTYYLMSMANAIVLSQWDGFRRDGFPTAVLNAKGFAGSVNGLPIFASTEFPDSEIVCGNRQLVQHKVFQPLLINGPFKSRDASTGKLIAAEEFYVEELNVTESLVPEKGAYVKIG